MIRARVDIELDAVEPEAARPAGCWWRNWSSRVTVEGAGLVCAGTILRFDLDPETFVTAG